MAVYFYLFAAAIFVFAFMLWNGWHAERLIGKVKNERIDRKKLYRFIAVMMVLQGALFLWAACTPSQEFRSYQLLGVLLIAAVEIIAKRSSIFEKKNP